MFTGIVEERGVVIDSGSRLRVACAKVAGDSGPGASVAVNGVCLTVLDRAGDRLTFDVSPETLRRTSLAELAPGDPVNLERPVTLLTRLGGHLVQGHVDGVGKVLESRDVEDGRELTLGLPRDCARYVVEKGSVAVDGVSLTVTGVGDVWFGVALIPPPL